jgi:NAD(P)-dependent dehydrogenase (short-subunit alcohol dehydrogenase family)
MSESALVAGVGPGLGLSLARAFAAEGLRVALLARDAARLHALTGGDPALLPLACDVTMPEQVTAAVAQVERDFGPCSTPARLHRAAFWRPRRPISSAAGGSAHSPVFWWARRQRG